jgi:hypothetical protein
VPFVFTKVNARSRDHLGTQKFGTEVSRWAPSWPCWWELRTHEPAGQFSTRVNPEEGQDAVPGCPMARQEDKEGTVSARDSNIFNPSLRTATNGYHA